MLGGKRHIELLSTPFKQNFHGPYRSKPLKLQLHGDSPLLLKISKKATDVLILAAVESTPGDLHHGLLNELGARGMTNPSGNPDNDFEAFRVSQPAPSTSGGDAPSSAAATYEWKCGRLPAGSPCVHETEPKTQQKLSDAKVPKLGQKRLLSILLLLAASRTRSAAITCNTSSPFPISPDFDIAKVTSLAQTLPSHSWEYGTTTEALLELFDPDYSVFGSKPFPVPTLQKQNVKSLEYASQKIRFGTGSDGLIDGNGAVGDPASLGVAAVMLGKTEPAYMNAAKQTMSYLVGSAKRNWNGAISHRRDIVEVW
ncbi:hypothetical protein NMY22_g11220 [Coprinellus aureogranulatus]|nr:hypothetical protein NMY22_g11220 [Coprinellus aureogranulatus]